jgi:drug/metabolite transporter (DMT)-like permease
MNSAIFLIILLLLVDSLHFVFARLLLPYLPPGTSAFYVLAVATLETAVFLGLRRDIQFSVLRQHLGFFLLVGFLVAASTSVNYTAVAFIDPGTAAMLSQTSILFALAFGLFWLRDRLTAGQLAGSLLAIAGVFVISFQPGDVLRFGSLLVLSSAFMYALHAAVVKRYGGTMSFGNFFLFRVASTTGFLFLFAAGRGELIWPRGEVWLFLILAGTIDVVVSRVLYYQVLRRLQISFHAILLTLSPVITILWSFFLFGARPTWQALLGGAAVLAGVAIVTLRRDRPATTPARKPSGAGST